MPDRVEESKAQQVARGGPDPQDTKGDAHPGSPTGTGATSPDQPPGTRRRGEGRRFVVLNTMVDSFERGQVVAESEFRKGADFDRLVEVGAVREAAGHEAGLDRVTTPEQGTPNLSYEQLVADKDRQIERLRVEKAELERRRASEKAERSQAESNQMSAQAAGLIAEKDKEIARLQGRVQQLEAQAAEQGDKGDKGEPANRAGQPTHHRGK